MLSKIQQEFVQKIKYTIKNETYDDLMIEAWKFHLKQMVLEKEPIKYLERFLNEKNT